MRVRPSALQGPLTNTNPVHHNAVSGPSTSLYTCPPAGGNVRATALAERYVATTVKNAAADADQPPEVVDALAAHSLRAGIGTAARTADVDEPRVGRLLGHTGTTTARYNRPHWDGRLHEILYSWILANPDQISA